MTCDEFALDRFLDVVDARAEEEYILNERQVLGENHLGLHRRLDIDSN